MGNFKKWYIGVFVLSFISSLPIALYVESHNSNHHDKKPVPLNVESICDKYGNRIYHQGVVAFDTTCD